MNDKERLQLEEELLMTCSKAQAINKYIDELEESSKLSELWCKSQEENRKYKEVIDKAIDFINNNGEKQYNHHDNYIGKWYSPDELDTILDILKEVE